MNVPTEVLPFSTAELQAIIQRLQRKLHDAKVQRAEWEKMYYQAIASTEVERLQTELAQAHATGTSTCADLTIAQVRLGKARDYSESLEQRVENLNQLLDASAVELAQAQIECNVLAMTFTDANELHATVQAELAQARTELKDLRRANREYGRQLAAMKENREFWFEMCHTVRIDRDKIRKTAQDQSDEVQELWLSPCEAEGLRRRLADMARNCDFWFKEAQAAEAERDEARKEAQAQSDEVQHNWLSPCQKAGLEERVKALGRQLAGMEAGRDFWRIECERNDKRLAPLPRKPPLSRLAAKALGVPEKDIETLRTGGGWLARERREDE